MKQFLALCAILGLAVAFAGCDKKKSEVTTETKVVTPEGQTTTTNTEKVETKGENPPPAK